MTYHDQGQHTHLIEKTRKPHGCLFWFCIIMIAPFAIVLGTMLLGLIGTVLGAAAK